jgi:DNA-binding LytR/AlgR family response regulator
VNIAICDDERVFREQLYYRVTDFFKIRALEVHIEQFYNATKLLEHDSISEFDIIFLDVAMPNIDGISAGRIIAKKSPKTKIIYVSGLIEHAPASHEIESAMRYIIKEQLDDKFDECMLTVLKQLNYQEKRVQIAFTDGEMRVNVQDVMYVEVLSHVLIFHFIPKSHTELTSRKYSLKEIQEILGSDLFLRVEQSFIVNMAYIEEFAHSEHGYSCRLSDGTSINVSQRRVKEARRIFFAYKGNFL